MLNIITADGITEKEFLKAMRKRAVRASAEASAAAASIIKDVSERGNAAVREYTRKFDKTDIMNFELDKKELEKAALRLDSSLIIALERAAENIRDFHERQKQQSWMVTREDGTILGQRVRPLKRVGIYAPGGKAAYPSTVLMNAVPAKVAGVGEIILATPPQADGGKNDVILAAAYIAGVDRVFTVGGAQAVAALAYGTESIPRVDKITGPGNIFVAEAKRLVFGQVDIDMIAGPSEILVIADNKADPAHIAADLLSQAEHDELASAILICLSRDTAEKAAAEFEKQAERLPRYDIIRKSANDYGAVIVCRNIDEAVALANEFAPEHLEIMTKNPFELLGRIDNSGSVFLGGYSPEPLGDYMAGLNHVLPTGGTARFFSPLSVDSFIKKSGFVYATKKSLAEMSGDIIALAEAEGLSAHAESIRIRR